MLSILIFEFILGVFLLFGGAELLVRYAEKFAIHIGVKPYLVAITVVGFSTSMPEALTAIIAQLQPNAEDIALGTVIGSNIANIALVLGIVLLIHPVVVTKQMRFREFPFFCVLVMLFFFFMLNHSIGMITGIFLLVLLCIYIAYQIYIHRSDISKDHSDFSIKKLSKELFFSFLGIGVLLLGAYILVTRGEKIATLLYIPQRVIALTLIALGTSLPELAISSVAAYRKKAEIALGNITGSNVFNLLFIVGIAAIIKPLVFDPHFAKFDIPMMIFLAFFLWIYSLFRDKLSRLLGGFLVMSYLVYIFVVVS